LLQQARSIGTSIIHQVTDVVLRRDYTRDSARGRGISKIDGVKQEPLVLETRWPSLQGNHRTTTTEQVPRDSLPDARTRTRHDSCALHDFSTAECG